MLNISTCAPYVSDNDEPEKSAPVMVAQNGPMVPSMKMGKRIGIKQVNQLIKWAALAIFVFILFTMFMKPVDLGFMKPKKSMPMVITESTNGFVGDTLEKALGM